jgi:hypothetical protein
VQPEQRAVGAFDRAEEVEHRDGGDRGRPVLRADHVRESAPGLHGAVKAWQVAVGAGQAERRDPDHDDAGVDL